MDQKLIDLYDDFTHGRIDRRRFLERGITLVGSVAALLAAEQLIAANPAAAAIVASDDPRLTTQRVTYPGKSGPVKAYLAKPKSATGKLPAIVVIHENRGLNAHIEDVARRAALEGYVALAPDALSALGGTPENTDAARELFGKLEVPVAVADLTAAVPFLKGHADSNGKVVAMGFCWGGGMVNQIAVNSPDLVAAAPYYGPVPRAEDAAKIKARMLLHYAGNDSFINPGIPAYEAALKQAGVRYQLHMYEGAQHAFNNDTSAERYNKQAADLAWQRSFAFFKEAVA